MRAGVLGVCVVAALLLVGCGSGRAGGPASPAPDASVSSPAQPEAPGTGSSELERGNDSDGTLDTAAAPDRAASPGEASPTTTAASEPASSETSPETDAETEPVATETEPVATEPAATAPAAAEPAAGAEGLASPEASADEPQWPSRFKQGAAPEWPYRGLVQLWHYPPSLGGQGWVLRYWSWDPAAQQHPLVHLEGLEIECLGRVALVVHGEHGVEVGGAPGDVSATYRVRWGGVAEPADGPSEELLEAVALRPSNVSVGTEGDRVFVGEGPQSRVYEMRHPLRGDGERWRVQARNDGELFVLTVHPAHLKCYSGVTWLSLAGTGELIACGANTAATAFVDRQGPEAELVLPEPDHVGTYLSCAPPLELTGGPW